MVDSLLFSINTVSPLFILIVLGWFIGYIKLVPKSFFEAADKIVFKLSLPVMLFADIIECNTGNSFNADLIVFCCVAITSVVLLSCLLVPIFIKDNPARGAMVQGIYRSNFAILGITLAKTMFPENGGATISLVMPFAIALFNGFAVIVFTVFAPKDKKLSPKEVFGGIFFNIIKNPLIIAVILAIVYKLIFKDIAMPGVLTKSMDYVSALALPLALFSMGAGFSLNSCKNKIKRAIAATVLKIAVMPLIVVTVAILLGFRDAPLGIIFIMFAGPSAVSGYIMAKNMYGDYELTGYITVLTTFFCIATMFVGIFILKYLAFI